MELKLVHEDDELLVIDKPSGLIVNNSRTAQGNTLQELVRTYLSPDGVDYFSQFDPGTDFVARCGLIHRLDKDTSGLILAAKTYEAFSRIQALFKERKVKKEYVAIVHGEVQDKNIEINAPIARDPKNKTKYAIVDGGRAAETSVTVIEVQERSGEKITKVSVEPKTGRTHQIRVHLCALAHPVLGDAIYSGPNQQQWAQQQGFNRLMLHAHKLSLEGRTFESPIPDIFTI